MLQYDILSELSQELRLNVMAKFLKVKFNDTRTVSQLVKVIKQEFSIK